MAAVAIERRDAPRSRSALLASVVVLVLVLAAVVVWIELGAAGTRARLVEAAERLSLAASGEIPPLPEPAAGPEEGAAAPAAHAGAEAEAPVGEHQVAALPAGLTEPGPHGPLPRIAADGQAPWQVFAQPFAAPAGTPRIAIVLTGMGLSAPATRTAIDRLPAGVTLAFVPYPADVETWLAKARAAGHETLLSMPLEPAAFPADDPGPRALLTSLPSDENLDRLAWTLGRGTGYVGVTVGTQSRFASAPEALRPVARALAERGLMLLDEGSAGEAAVLAHSEGGPAATADGWIDAAATPAAIDASLAGLEAKARAEGSAIGLAAPYPVTFERLAAWIASLEGKGLALAPLTAVVAP
jgi:polysaccharide deacetylase 2 family uncharacterized protein YibQ